MVSWTCRRALLNWPTLRSGGVFRLRGAAAISQQGRAAQGLLGKMSLRSILEGGCRGKILLRCVPGLPAMVIFRRGAFSGLPTVAIFRRDAPPGGRLPMAKCSRNAFPSVRQWQYIDAMRSPASGRGKIMPWCVTGRRSVAAFSLHAFPKGPRTGKTPVRGKIRAPCIRNELALARYARHASEKPRKPPLEDTSREYLVRKGPFSLHGPLESCIARRSCHPPPNSASDRNHGAALMGGGTGRGRLLVGRGDAAKGVRGVVGCRALAAKLASVKLCLQVSDADNLAES